MTQQQSFHSSTAINPFLNSNHPISQQQSIHSSIATNPFLNSLPTCQVSFVNTAQDSPGLIQAVAHWTCCSVYLLLHVGAILFFFPKTYQLGLCRDTRRFIDNLLRMAATRLPPCFQSAVPLCVFGGLRSGRENRMPFEQRCVFCKS